MKRRLIFAALAITGCVRVEGGDKPIKIDMTVTLKVDQQLDQFYSFEDKYNHSATTQSSTQPAANPGGAQ